MFSKSRLVALVIAADIVALMISKATLSEQTIVEVDAAYAITDACINCGICYAMAPDYFMECGNEHAVFVYGFSNCRTCTDDAGPYIQDAMDECPVEAIVRTNPQNKCECWDPTPCGK